MRAATIGNTSINITDAASSTSQTRYTPQLALPTPYLPPPTFTYTYTHPHKQTTTFTYTYTHPHTDAHTHYLIFFEYPNVFINKHNNMYSPIEHNRDPMHVSHLTFKRLCLYIAQLAMPFVTNIRGWQRLRIYVHCITYYIYV